MRVKTLISKRVLHIIETYLHKQDVKGIETYGQSLDTVSFGDYDWDKMALEELADAIKYVVVENMRLKWENKRLTEKYEKLYCAYYERMTRK